jgi:hypothetical protein
MAQKVVVQLVDDLDGTPLEPGNGETVAFGLDGTSYEIDLSDPNADTFRRTLEPYVKAARKVSGRRSPRSTSASKPSNEATAIREWARSQGLKVSERGRVSGEVVDAYSAAH